MVFKKSETNEKLSPGKLLIQSGKERLKLRSNKCEGCYAPKGTLTVKKHTELTWEFKDIELKEEGLNLPCKLCGIIRFLSLGSVSLDLFKQDVLEGYSTYMLLKDDKYNAIVGVGELQELDLSKFMPGLEIKK